MTTLPKVVVGGYPRSGTSFLCRLVVEMGFWPGSYYNLKMPNNNNKFGYWEHLPLRKVVWENCGFKDKIIYCKPRTIPHVPVEFEEYEEVVNTLRTIASDDRVEVYKDNALPLIYKVFPDTHKFIVIERNWEEVHASVLKMERTNLRFLDKSRDGCFWGIPHANIETAVGIYYELTRRMAKCVSCLILRYEDFSEDYDTQVYKIADYLELDASSLYMERLRNSYRRGDNEENAA